MKRSLMVPISLFALLAGLCMTAGIGRAEEGAWKTNFEAAKAQAKAENKTLLVDFTGSDWCGFCIKLRDEVFEKEPFKNEVSKQFVLVELDFPRNKKLPDELKTQNDNLKKEYKVSGFPTICLLSAEGELMAKFTGYGPGTAEKYLTRLKAVPEVWASVQKMKSELASVQGLDRAKLLDQLVDAYENKLTNPIDELEAWGKEIVTLDADNKAGLKNKYLCREILAEAQNLEKQRKLAEAIAALDKALALEGITAEQKQEILFKQGMNQFNLKDIAAALATMKKADEASSTGKLAAQIKGRIRIFNTIIEQQAAIAKDMESLDKAEGIERAKLLDKLIDANKKLQMYGAAKATPIEINKWTAEIVELDADNAAGLKSKHEFAKLLGEAAALSNEKKFEEGLAAIDKAIALAGVTPEQTQEALMAKGMTYLRQKDYDKCLESFNKAVEAAPKTMRAMQLKNIYIKSVEQMKKKAAAQPL